MSWLRLARRLQLAESTSGIQFAALAVMRIVATIVAALLPAGAFADPDVARNASAPSSIAALAGPGVRKTWHDDGVSDEAGGALAMIAYRMHPRLALGLHAGIARTTGSTIEDSRSFLLAQDWSVVASDVALALHYTATYFTVTPRIGRRFTRLHETTEHCTIIAERPVNCETNQVTRWENDATVYGVTITGGTRPIALFLDLHATASAVEYQPAVEAREAAVTFGLAYWR